MSVVAVAGIAGCGRGGFSPNDGAGNCATCGAVAFDAAYTATRTDTTTLMGRCVSTATLTASGPEGPIDVVCGSGRFALQTPTETTDGARTYVVTASDGTTASAVWARDTVPPVFDSGTQLAGGASVSRVRNARLHVAVHDATTTVTALCVKVDGNRAPASSDACWLAVSGAVIGAQPAAALSLDDVPATLGFLAGVFSARLWARDLAGNISELTNGLTGTEGTDLLTVTYTPNPPPFIADVLATASNTPSTPLTTADLTISAGRDVIVKWSAHDDQALPPTPVSIYYTTDDATYVLATRQLANAANGNCAIDAPTTAIDDNDTGCWLWEGGAPTGAYFRVRVVVEDVDGYLSASSSAPLNAGPLREIAGNVDVGLDASASAALLASHATTASGADSQAVVITPSGELYFRDSSLGILRVDPTDGTLRVFIPLGTASTDGVIGTASVVAPRALLVDFDGRLLILDNDRVRRVTLDADPPYIETILGGGTSSTDGARGVDYLLPQTAVGDQETSSVAVLPNGELWLLAKVDWSTIASGNRIVIYDMLNDAVRTLALSGVGDRLNSSVDLSNCGFVKMGVSFDPVAGGATGLIGLFQHASWHPGCNDTYDYAWVRFDPTTGARIAAVPYSNSWEPDNGPVQSLDGKLRFANRTLGVLSYDPTSNAWTWLLGGQTVGSCPDGAAAASCPMEAFDVFTSGAGQMVILDNGRVRTIDANGDMQTIAGEGASAGDGGLPTSARLGPMSTVQSWSSSSTIRYVVLDTASATFREFMPGNTITAIAGNGDAGDAQSLSVPATSTSLLLNAYGRHWSSFAVNPANGDVFYPRGESFIARLNRSSGSWVDIAGNDASTLYYNQAGADGAVGNTIDLLVPNDEMHPPRILGFDGAALLVDRYSVTLPDRVAMDSLLKTYAITDGTQGAVAGALGPSGNAICDNGTALAACNLPAADEAVMRGAVYDTATGSWYVAVAGSSRIVRLQPGQPVGTLATVANQVDAFTVVTGDNAIYYCSQGTLRSYQMNSGADSALPWAIPSMRCSGLNMLFDPTTRLLVFVFTSGASYGVAQYQL